MSEGQSGPAPEGRMWAYRGLRALLRIAIGIFFRRIVVVGTENVPEKGAVLFCGNHPNSLLDPILITCVSGRIVHFAAKDTLFQSRLLRFFLGMLGSVPIRRRMDHGGESLDNTDAFEALYEVLGSGRSMGIFPEGISHDASQLARLKTGAARIAFGAEERRPGTAPRLVPCGLYYAHRKRFRSSVLVQFGPPIELDRARLEAYREDPRAAAKALTEDVEAGLRALTVNAPDWETVRVLDGVRRLYQPPRIPLEQRVELARRFNKVYPLVAGDPGVRALFDRVREYQARLDTLGLTDRDLRRDIGPTELLARLGGHLVLLAFWTPLALAGAVLHLPVGILMGFCARRFAPRKDVIATTKFVGGFLLVVFAYTLLFAALAVGFSAWLGLACLVVLPLSGFALLKVIDRAQAMSRLFATTTQIFLLGRVVDELRAERKALEEAVVAAVSRHLPEDMAPLFPERVRAAAGAAPEPAAGAAPEPADGASEMLGEEA